MHAVHLVELVERWGVGAPALLAGIVDSSDLANPEGKIPIARVIALVERARLLTKEPGLGIHLGLKMRVSAHGYLGFAAMLASNLREALELVIRFGPTRSDALRLRLSVEGRVASVHLEERCDFGKARDALVLGLLLGLVQIGGALTGASLNARADVALREPDYFQRFKQRLPMSVRFGRRATALHFDAALLALPLQTADRAALRLATQQCERELRALAAEQDLVERVRILLAGRELGIPSLQEAARTLHLSTRTLKRHLSAHEATFTDLTDEVRRERALRLLRRTELSMDEVAERLGYTDVSNFRRAFLRLTGSTPGRMRLHSLGRKPRQ